MAYCHFCPVMELMMTYIKPSPKPGMGNRSKMSIQDPARATAQRPGRGACGRGTLRACVDPTSSLLATTFVCEPFHPHLRYL